MDGIFQRASVVKEKIEAKEAAIKQLCADAVDLLIEQPTILLHMISANAIVLGNITSPEEFDEALSLCALETGDSIFPPSGVDGKRFNAALTYSTNLTEATDMVTRAKSAAIISYFLSNTGYDKWIAGEEKTEGFLPGEGKGSPKGFLTIARGLDAEKVFDWLQSVFPKELLDDKGITSARLGKLISDYRQLCPTQGVNSNLLG